MSNSETPNISLPGGYRFRFCEELESTSDEAKRLARGGTEGNLWILARRQTRGRGRMGREWISDEGNLFASLLLRPQVPHRRFPELSLLAAVAVAETLEYLIRGAAEVTCKWPNDVLVEGRKVAGILLESEDGGESGKPWAVIGIGINLEHAPDKVDFPAVALKDYIKEKASIFSMIEKLAEVFSAALPVWFKHGFVPLRERWLARAWGLGERVVVEGADSQVEGVFEGLSPAGALILREKSGQCREILSGTLRKA